MRIGKSIAFAVKTVASKFLAPADVLLRITCLLQLVRGGSTKKATLPESQTSSSTGTHKSAEKDSSNSTKSIKFRVEIVPENDSTTLRVQLVHKQGN